MEARELRIGSWVRYNGFYRKIVSLDLSTEITAEPIELTEEILLKCGFNNEWSKYVYDSNTIISIRVRDGLYFVSANNVQLREIKHLHQLQNLYYALTGEELEVCLA